MDFSDETDSKLKAIIARPLISYEGKLYCATEKTKEQIKQRVESLFNVGERIVYYESFFQNNSDWLIAAGIDSMWLLKAFLASTTLPICFTYYFEQNNLMILNASRWKLNRPRLEQAFLERRRIGADVCAS